VNIKKRRAGAWSQRNEDKKLSSDLTVSGTVVKKYSTKMSKINLKEAPLASFLKNRNSYFKIFVNIVLVN
jgi:hypothetical protein